MPLKLAKKKTQTPEQIQRHKEMRARQVERNKLKLETEQVILINSSIRDRM